jgi:hypothetical protein
MAIMRDDQPFDPAHTIFGQNFATETALGSTANEYSFENSILPATQITLLTEYDPTDRAANRSRVKMVPTIFTIWFRPAMTGIALSTLEDLLHLGIGYWIDGNGTRRPGNDMGTAPPHVRVRNYRYRALDQPTTRFSVDVEFGFLGPDANAAKDGGPTTPVLIVVRFNRDYFKPTPA